VEAGRGVVGLVQVGDLAFVAAEYQHVARAHNMVDQGRPHLLVQMWEYLVSSVSLKVLNGWVQLQFHFSFECT
jgi:hypothetical protein